ncbi:hypothetical protein BO82DRAFT_254046, partial [Aspergillus uvarum CBS 121591]
VGPLDKRKIITRCQPCATRRVKCAGGHPCDRCLRLQKPCVPQPQPQPRLKHAQVRFVYTLSNAAYPNVPSQVPRPDGSIYLDHFASFLQRCRFSDAFAAANADIISVIGRYPLLRHITMAIGALEAGRKGAIRSFGAQESPLQIAFRACGRSIRSLRATTVSTGDPVYREDVLWCTFLHGLFELMAESSGDSFATHVVFGTSRVLALLEPTTSPLSLPTKSLIDAFGILESHRAILYGDNATLDPARFDIHQSQPPCQTPSFLAAANARPLMLDRLFDEIEAIDPDRRSSDPRLDARARAGLAIREALLIWRDEATSLRRPLPIEPSTQLAVVLNHALELYHCMNFTFYPCWSTRTVPRLTQSEVDANVAAILHLSGCLLADTDIPAVLLLFPVRMAGAHASGQHARERVVDTIRQIRQKGFVVADRIEVDLHEVWAYE